MATIQIPALNPTAKGLKNPWSEKDWNITRQSLIVKEYGLETAEEWAKLAGTVVGGPRPRVTKPKAGPQGPRGRPGEEGDTGQTGTPGTADEAAQEITTSGNSLTINRTLGRHVRLILESDIDSIEILNWPVALIRGSVTLEIYNMASWGLTGWPIGTLWNGATEPTIPAGGVATFVLFTSDGGNTVLASVAFMSA